jgi:hypothetical protein
MQKKHFSPIVQPLAHPNTQKLSIFWAFISKSPFFSKKGVAQGMYLPAAVKGLSMGVHVESYLL